VVVWVEFIARMSLAVLILVPSGVVLLWATRRWSGAGTPSSPALLPQGVMDASEYLTSR
jgi:hypothetical protein